MEFKLTKTESKTGEALLGGLELATVVLNEAIDTFNEGLIDETIGAGSRAVDGAILLKEAVFTAVRQADHRFDGAAPDSQGRSRTNYVGQAALDALYGTGGREVTTDLPVQEFQIGQRVRKGSEPPFVIRGICLTNSGWILYSISEGYPYFTASELTLAPKRPPYVPSERSVFVKEFGQEEERIVDNIAYRCETDAELAARHAIERAAYDAQGDEA